MSNATEVGQDRRDQGTDEIAAALRAEWRMIGAVSLRPHPVGEGFEADLRLDPVVVRGSLEQQGYPRTSAAMAKIEARRQAALDECVQRVNRRLPATRRIQTFSVIG